MYPRLFVLPATSMAWAHGYPAEQVETRFRPSVIPARRKRVRTLFRGAWTYVEVARDFFIAATLRERSQHFLIARAYFAGVEIDHGACSRL
jgi:hypothetical protein